MTWNEFVAQCFTRNNPKENRAPTKAASIDPLRQRGGPCCVLGITKTRELGTNFLWARRRGKLTSLKAQCYSLMTMVRSLFILILALSVTGCTLGSILQSINGSDCQARCCRVARRCDSHTSSSSLRCLMQCEHRSENQGVPQSPVLRTERDGKVVAQLAPAVAVIYSTLDVRSLHSTARTNIASTHIYLRTGTLLI